MTSPTNEPKTANPTNLTDEGLRSIAHKLHQGGGGMSKVKLTSAIIAQMIAYCNWAAGSGTYYGNKIQFINRHQNILKWLKSLREGEMNKYAVPECCPKCSPEYIDGKPACNCDCHHDE